MATVEDIQHLVAQMEQSLSAKFEEIDRKHTILIQGLQQQFQQHEQIHYTRKSVTSSNSSFTTTTSEFKCGTWNSSKSKRIPVVLGKVQQKTQEWSYNLDSTVEEKCALQNIAKEEIGKWAKVHLEGNALAYISRLGISDWE